MQRMRSQRNDLSGRQFTRPIVSQVFPDGTQYAMVAWMLERFAAGYVVPMPRGAVAVAGRAPVATIVERRTLPGVRRLFMHDQRRQG